MSNGVRYIEVPDEPEVKLARDPFTARMRELSSNPGAVKSSSRGDVVDDYGNLDTWTIDTFRTLETITAKTRPGAKAERKTISRTTAFVQRMTPEGGLRLVLPPSVMATLLRQDAALTGQRRRLGARQALETRRARGDRLGNPDALKRARKASR
jgi:hypothetical protein